jgi:hypothetical protein
MRQVWVDDGGDGTRERKVCTEKVLKCHARLMLGDGNTIHHTCEPKKSERSDGRGGYFLLRTDDERMMTSSAGRRGR